eukprot:COSAG01_NODE_6986_length_3403_cov_3.437651_2_plen_59_part_00
MTVVSTLRTDCVGGWVLTRYATPSGGADDAVMWPGEPWDPEDGDIFLDEDALANLPEL